MLYKSTICCTMGNAAFTLALLLLLACSGRPCYAADLQTQGFENFRARNYAKALECFTAALKEQPRNWLLLQSMGNCHMRMGQNDAALADLQKSIEVGGLHASQCTIMAAALEGLGQPKQALSWLKLACKAEPARLGDPGMQAAIRRLEDPLVNPGGSPDSPDYMSGLVDVNRWRKQDMSLKVYVRKNIQLTGFYDVR